MKETTLQKVTATLKKEYPDVGIRNIEVDERTGKSTFYLDPTRKSLAFLDQGAVVPRQFREKAATITRDSMDRSALDTH